MMTVLLFTLLFAFVGLYFEDRNIEELRKESTKFRVRVPSNPPPGTLRHAQHIAWNMTPDTYEHTP